MSVQDHENFSKDMDLRQFPQEYLKILRLTVFTDSRLVNVNSKSLHLLTVFTFL